MMNFTRRCERPSGRRRSVASSNRPHTHTHTQTERERDGEWERHVWAEERQDRRDRQ